MSQSSQTGGGGSTATISKALPTWVRERPVRTLQDLEMIVQEAAQKASTLQPDTPEGAVAYARAGDFQFMLEKFKEIGSYDK